MTVLMTWVWWLPCVCHPLSLGFLSLAFLSHHTPYCTSAPSPMLGMEKALNNCTLSPIVTHTESPEGKGHTKCCADEGKVCSSLTAVPGFWWP